MDEQLRELERLAEQGDPSAGAELLRYRLRTGDLDEAPVRLLARLGDPAALLLFPDDDASQLRETWPALVALDPRHGLRALLAALEAGASRYAFWLPSEECVPEVAAGCRAWLEAGGAPPEDSVDDWARRAREAVNLVNARLLDRYRLGQLAGSELRALEYLAWTARDAAEGMLQVSVGEPPTGDSLIRLVGLWRESGWGDLRRAIREELRGALLR